MAAVGIAGNLTFIVLAISQMLGVGTTTLVSHAAGRKDHARALLVFNQSQSLSVLVGVVFLAVSLLLRDSYTSALGADPQTARQAGEYLTWFIPAMALQFAMVAMGAALRGTGNFKPGTIVATATVILNMVLAPILIFGWGTGVPLGVAGAAISSLVAVAVGVIWLATYFIKPSAYLHFIPSQWVPQFPLWSQMLKIGLPAGAEFGLMAVYMVVVYSISRPFGAAAQAGFGIGLRVVQAGFMPVVALGFSVAPVAGQNFGARLADRVKKTYFIARLDGGGRDGGLGRRVPLRRRGDGAILQRRPAGHRRRLGVPAHHRLDVRGIGPGLRVVEHVPGARQHLAVAGGVVRAHARDRGAGDLSRPARRLRAPVDLVSVGRNDRLSSASPCSCCCSASSACGSARARCSGPRRRRRGLSSQLSALSFQLSGIQLSACGSAQGEASGAVHDRPGSRNVPAGGRMRRFVTALITISLCAPALSTAPVDHAD